MTDAEKSSSEKPTAANADMQAAYLDFLKSRSRVPLAAILLPPVIIFGAFYAFYMLRLSTPGGTTVAPSSTAVVLQLEQRLTTDEAKLQELEAKLAEIDARAPATPAPVGDTQAAAHVQNDVAALMATVTALQTEIKQAGTTAAATWQAAQNLLAAGVAFIRLRADSDAGRGFADDLAALRAATGSEPGVQEPLTQLEPYAAKGAPRLDALRETFARLEGPASVAADKAAAQDWRERLLADLKGFISIRPLHGAPASDALAAAESALDAGDLPAALDAVKTLPPEAQDALKGWKEQAEARIEVDRAMQTLAARLATPAATRNEP